MTSISVTKFIYLIYVRMRVCKNYKRIVSLIRKKISLNQINLCIAILSKSESVKFSLIGSVICLFTDSSVKTYFSLLNQWKIWLIWQWKIFFSLSNQSIFTEIISEIWLIYSNLFLAIWISQISLIISRFWLIQI